MWCTHTHTDCVSVHPFSCMWKPEQDMGAILNGLETRSFTEQKAQSLVEAGWPCGFWESPCCHTLPPDAEESIELFWLLKWVLGIGTQVSHCQRKLLIH